MSLRQKRSVGQTRVIAFGQHATLEFPQLLQIAEHLAFEFAAAFRISRNLFQLFQRPTHVSVVDRLPQRSGALEVRLSQLVNVADAQLLSGAGLDEALDLLRSDSVHAPERPQRVQVRVDGKRSTEQDRQHGGSDLGQQPTAHTDPALAARQGLGHVRQALTVDLHQLVIDSFQRFVDAPLGDGRQQARFASVIPHPILLKTRVQGRQFDVRGHLAALREGGRSENSERKFSDSSEPCCVVSHIPAATAPVLLA
jgi:hypothetical protein